MDIEPTDLDPKLVLAGYGPPDHGTTNLYTS